MTWQVALDGDPADLGLLADSLDTGDFVVRMTDRGYVLTGPAFYKCGSASEAKELAERVVPVLSTAAQVGLGSVRPVKAIGVVYYKQANGEGGGIMVFLSGAAQATARMIPPTVQVTSEGLTTTYRPADFTKGWLDLALSDPLVARAMTFRGSSDVGWVNLYRIYEVIEEDVGRRRILEEKWATGAELTAFTRTANSYDALGGEARHGFESTDPPPRPMTKAAAQELIDCLLTSWISLKAQEP